MKKNIHPKLTNVKFICSCGNSIETRSVFGKEIMQIEVCSSCHPFYTGKWKIVDTSGRVDSFRKKYKNHPNSG